MGLLRLSDDYAGQCQHQMCRACCSSQILLMRYLAVEGRVLQGRVSHGATPRALPCWPTSTQHSAPALSAGSPSLPPCRPPSRSCLASAKCSQHSSIALCMLSSSVQSLPTEQHLCQDNSTSCRRNQTDCQHVLFQRAAHLCWGTLNFLILPSCLDNQGMMLCLLYVKTMLPAVSMVAVVAISYSCSGVLHQILILARSAEDWWPSSR